MQRSSVAPAVRTALAAGAAGALLLLGACGQDATRAGAPAGDASEAATSDGTTAPGGQHPEVALRDYVYRLEVLCYCPQVGPVRVEVADGEVVSATTLGVQRGFPRGADAPEFARLTINDIIAQANDPQVDEASVTWPDGQDWPSAVTLDRVARAVDDEVTYRITGVRPR